MAGRIDLLEIFRVLLQHFGPQSWWPAQSDFETMVGAILTQNTNWLNVEKALRNLQAENLLNPHALDQIKPEKLALLIRPAGYFNIKTRRLKNFLRWFCRNYDGRVDLLLQLSVTQLREQLLAINGIGPETADSIILYALRQPTFVVDAYTCRIFVRHGAIDSECSYEQVKQFFEDRLPSDVQLFNEFHALLVQVGKNFCKKTLPLCDSCPLNSTFAAKYQNLYI